MATAWAPLDAMSVRQPWRSSIGVVFGDENAHAIEAWGDLESWSGGRFERQIEIEARARALMTGAAHRAAHQFHKVLGDGESQTGPPVLAGAPPERCRCPYRLPRSAPKRRRRVRGRSSRPPASLNLTGWRYSIPPSTKTVARTRVWKCNIGRGDRGGRRILARDQRRRRTWPFPALEASIWILRRRPAACMISNWPMGFVGGYKVGRAVFEARAERTAGGVVSARSQ